MWKTKTFKKKEDLQAWVDKNNDTIQWEQIVVNNGYGVTYRKLRIIDLGDDD